MKKIILLFCLVLSIGVFAQNSDVTFKKTKHSFGKIKQSVPASYTFTFTNTSAKPVVIEFANAECGCTTPEYSKAPIAKGKSSNIKVTYNAANPGEFRKNVNIKFAHANLPVVLTIDGVVETPKAKTK